MSEIEEEEEEEYTNIEIQDIDVFDLIKNYESYKKNYKTSPYLTKYEKTRVLSDRASQIINGEKIFISNPEIYKEPFNIAMQKLKEKKIPFLIKRPYGNTFEYWKLSDLIL